MIRLTPTHPQPSLPRPDAHPTRRIARWIVAGLVLMILLSAAGWTSPPPASVSHNRDGVAALTPTPAPTRVLVQDTPIPLEWKENINQTYGVVFGGVIMVVIIIVGTLSAISHRNGRKPG